MYWTMFNNAINTRVKPDASFLLLFSLPLSVTCNGHTLFSCTISCNYDNDDDYPPLSLFTYPPSLFFSISSFLPLFLPLYILPTVMTVPFRRAVCYLPSRVSFAFSSRFLTRFLSHRP